jgi:hypothetical protein
MTVWLSPQDLQEAQMLLTNLFTEVSEQEGTLDGGTKLGIGATQLQALRETKVRFGNPRSELIRLTDKLFKETGVKLTARLKEQMQKQFDFYYMTLTVSMQTSPAIQFEMMECMLEFGPKGSNEPIIHSIFPITTWKGILSAGIGLSLALNGNLEWSVGIDTAAVNVMANLPGNIKAHVSNKDPLKAYITIPNYSFNLGKNEIEARGEGSSECSWRIQKPELKKSQTVHFAIVFKVSKGIRSIDLTGLVAVEPNKRWLASTVRNVFEFLSEPNKALIQRNNEDSQGKDRLPKEGWKQE